MTSIENSADSEALLPVSDAKEQKCEPRNGVVQTALLVIANCAGAGLLSTPKAVNQASLTGGMSDLIRSNAERLYGRHSGSLLRYH